MVRVAKKPNRPLLKAPDPRAVMERLMAERYPVYAQADVTVTTREARREDIAEEVLEGLAILVTPPPEVDALDEVMELARQHGLAFHDAIYLDLALQRHAALASRDARLLDAARAAGVDVFDLRD